MQLRTRKATRVQTTAHNRGLVLSTIFDRGQISRADTARATGLTRTAVSAIVTNLMKRCLVEEV
ncbi:MAG TPA: ROK family transcriptional regulator, partial [Anaerolineae bacterium]|nr:ROK family transcriptional regulator [Anaerolineae bacterium]